jgi:hypothetical protein
MIAPYQPKGGMCGTCAWRASNCAGLPFAAMPVIGRDQATGAKIVRCTEHLRIDRTEPSFAVSRPAP